MRLVSLICGLMTVLAVASGFATASSNPPSSRLATRASTAVVRAFAQTALQHLKGPAQRPFLDLLRTLPPAKQVGVTISAKATKNMACSGGVCTPTGPIANLNVSDLTRLLGDGSVTIGTTAQAPDIFVNTPFSWASANGLTLQAIGNIVVNKGVSDAGPAPLTITYNATGGGGSLSFGPKGHISFLGTGNPLTINSQGYILANNIQLLAQLIARNPSGSFALSANYNAKQDGKYSHSPIQTLFQGNFEGLGNRITGLHVESEGQSSGLFQQTGATAYLANLNVAGKFQVDGPYIGGLVANNGGTIFQAVFDGSIDLVGNACGFGAPAIGGLIGFNSGTISFSHATGSISGVVLCQFEAGGLIGRSNTGSLDHSWAGVTLSLSGTGDYSSLGGLIGEFSNTVPGTDLSFATGSVTFAGADHTVSGGLIGSLESGVVSRSSASGPVSAPEGSSLVGGLLGIITGLTDASVATGAVNGGPGCSCGGFVGDDEQQGLSITNSTSYGTVAGGSGSYIGGFVGDDRSEGSTMSNDGWCTTSSGITDPSQGAGNIPNDPGIAPFSC
jgi:hypothetical protein